MKKNHGNTLPVIIMLIGIMMILALLVGAIFMGTVNGLIHHIKTEMYLINKAAILSVNKNKANIDDFSYDVKEYEKFFKKMLQKNLRLDETMENPNGIVQKVTIEDYTIYQKNKKDVFTKKKTEGTVIHTVLTVKVKPLILSKQFEKILTFQVHEDVFLEMAKY